jgi:glycerophosphoryl diester phosphodiesterase
MKLEILAHRANLSGPDPKTENSLESIGAALAQGFGLETDLRRDFTGRFYIAHDPQPWRPETALPAFTKLFQKYAQQTIAMNVKELGYEEQLIALYHEGALGPRSFYFDFELLEPATPGHAQRIIRSLPGGESVRLASRLSDRNEPVAQTLAIPGEIVWADEFDSLWLTAEDVRAIRAAGRQVYVISPELHGFSEKDRLARWADFKNWGVDGLCTDYALSAREYFSE